MRYFRARAQEPREASIIVHLHFLCFLACAFVIFVIPSSRRRSNLGYLIKEGQADFISLHLLNRFFWIQARLQQAEENVDVALHFLRLCRRLLKDRDCVVILSNWYGFRF